MTNLNHSQFDCNIQVKRGLPPKESGTLSYIISLLIILEYLRPAFSYPLSLDKE
jgi:hypothetical protein